MTRTRIPDDVLSAAHARSRARADRDWTEADRLRAEIEAAGWKVVDRGTDFALSPLTPPDIAIGDRIRYGASENVPTRAAEPPVGIATVVLVATDHPDDLRRCLAGMQASAPDGTSIVIVADDPSDAQAAALDAIDDAAIEMMWTSDRLGPVAATNIGIRRAMGPIVIVVDPRTDPSGDVVTPLVRALDDPTVGVAGGWGMVASDLRSFVDASPGDVDAVSGDALAFRRSDHASRGPLDERFRVGRSLAAWWSLVLRDEGEGILPRRAIAVDAFPATRPSPQAADQREDPEAARHAKRDFYRIHDRFGARRDLLGGPR